jgi:hypothetical protein
MKALLYPLVCLLLICLFLCRSHLQAQAQQNQVVTIETDLTTSTKTAALTKDTLRRLSGRDTVTIIPPHSPGKATLRSAILPGWGQAYNKEYWKIPIVYGAIGVPAGFFVYNNIWYKETKKAYEIRVTNDTLNFPSIHKRLEPLGAESLRFYRNSFRRDRDYSILYFVIAWALNVVDATVFGHLKDFDVSPDLSMKVKPSFNASPSGNTTGLSLVFGLKSSTKPKGFSFR